MSAETFSGRETTEKKQGRNISTIMPLSLLYLYHVWKSRGHTGTVPLLSTPMLSKKLQN